jgi:hypothetical protein
MDLIIFILFAAALLAMGTGYYIFCKNISGSLECLMADDKKTREEGGDNWPDGSMSLEYIIAGCRMSDSEKEKRVREKGRSRERQLSRELRR